MSPAGVVVPIKQFGSAKGRLADALSPDERSALARQMAQTVLAAAEDLPVWVVCNDVVVARWALDRGVNVAWVAVDGLNPSVSRAVEMLSGRYDRVVVAHADLPKAVSLRFLTEAQADEVIIVTDRHHDGSNVVSVPTGSDFRFCYGPASAAAHQGAASAAGLRSTVIEDPALSWDVDQPADLEGLTPS